MKGRTYLFSYLSALVIGILLLVFHESSGLFEGVVIAMGILIIIPSAIMLIAGFLRKVTTASKWYGVIASVAGLVFGIWMLCMPSFFINASIYTLGILLILAGVAGILFVINAARPASVNYLWMIVPVLAVAGGLIIMFLGPATMQKAAALVSGVVLIVYAVNGFASLAREGKAARIVANDLNHDRKNIERHESEGGL